MGELNASNMLFILSRRILIDLGIAGAIKRFPFAIFDTALSDQYKTINNSDDSYLSLAYSKLFFFSKTNFDIVYEYH